MENTGVTVESSFMWIPHSVDYETIDVNQSVPFTRCEVYSEKFEDGDDRPPTLIKFLVHISQSSYYTLEVHYEFCHNEFPNQKAFPVSYMEGLRDEYRYLQAQTPYLLASKDGSSFFFIKKILQEWPTKVQVQYWANGFPKEIISKSNIISIVQFIEGMEFSVLDPTSLTPTNYTIKYVNKNNQFIWGGVGEARVRIDFNRSDLFMTDNQVKLAVDVGASYLFPDIMKRKKFKERTMLKTSSVPPRKRSLESNENCNSGTKKARMVDEVPDDSYHCFVCYENRLKPLFVKCRCCSQKTCKFCLPHVKKCPFCRNSL